MPKCATVTDRDATINSPAAGPQIKLSHACYKWGSQNITFDGRVHWNFETEDWEIVWTELDCYCNTCGDHTEALDVEVLIQVTEVRFANEVDRAEYGGQVPGIV